MVTVMPLAAHVVSMASRVATVEASQICDWDRSFPTFSTCVGPGLALPATLREFVPTASVIQATAEGTRHVAVADDRRRRALDRRRPFPDRAPTHQLTQPPLLRVRSSDIPLLEWLRYYSDGNAWAITLDGTTQEFVHRPRRH